MDECTLRAVLRRVVLARVYSKGSVDDGDTHECTPRAVLGGVYLDECTLREVLRTVVLG